MDTEEVKDIFVPIGTFDKTRLRILDPVAHSFMKGNSEVEWTTSEGRYINDDGEECELYFDLPEQFCFGINAVYGVGTETEDKTLENAKGLQICYSLTGMKTIENPTKDEKYAISVLKALWEASWDKMQAECERSDDLLVPNPTYNSFLAAQKRKDPELAVKPIFAYPQKPDPKNPKKKVEDRTKPQRAYIKLLTKGEGRKMRCQTQIYGPGDKQDKTGLKYIDVRGRIHPLFKWEGVFWGSHGQKAPYGASVRLRVAQMNFTPQPDEIPKRRMLSPNAAPAVEDDGSDDDGHGRYATGQGEHDEAYGSEDEGFIKPGDDDDPMDVLKSAGKDKKAEEDEPPPSNAKNSGKQKVSTKKSAKHQPKDDEPAPQSKAELRKAALLKKRAAKKSKENEDDEE